MRTATIHAISAEGASGYAWKWLCSSEATESATVFPYYYECLSDARRHGYHVELTRPHGEMAPAGLGYTIARAA